MENTTTTRNKMNIHPAMEQAIRLGQTVRFKYAGNSRHVIPLAYGRLRDGKDALLCYKLEALPNGEIGQFEQVYKEDWITDIEATGQHVPFSFATNYKLEKRFMFVSHAAPGIKI